MQIKSMGLDTIAMVKKTGQTCYRWQGERLNIKQIFSRNRKRPGRSKYLLRVEVMIQSRDKHTEDIPARTVYVRNRAKKKEWLAIICTDMRLSYDALTAHTVIVFVRFMLLALEQRTAMDERTLGDLFLLMVDELKEITFSLSIQRLLSVLLECVGDVFRPTEKQISLLTENFVSRLPHRYHVLLEAD